MSILMSLKNDWNDGILENFAMLCQVLTEFNDQMYFLGHCIKNGT